MPASQIESPTDDPAASHSVAIGMQLGTTSMAESETSASHLFSTKENSAFKWQRARGVVGALEVYSEPMLKVRDDLKQHYVPRREKTFQYALQAWDDLKLREDFVKACEKLPAEMCCCGYMRDQDGTKRRFVTLLNDGWVKTANKKLLRQGVKIDAFLWNWQNASGKAETNIIMFRFFELSSYRFRRASNDESIDLELLSEQDDIERAPPEQEEMARS